MQYDTHAHKFTHIHIHTYHWFWLLKVDLYSYAISPFLSFSVQENKNSWQLHVHFLLYDKTSSLNLRNSRISKEMQARFQERKSSTGLLPFLLLPFSIPHLRWMPGRTGPDRTLVLRNCQCCALGLPRIWIHGLNSHSRISKS